MLWTQACCAINDVQTGRTVQFDEGGDTLGTGAAGYRVLCHRGVGVVNFNRVGGDVHIGIRCKNCS